VSPANPAGPANPASPPAADPTHLDADEITAWLNRTVQHLNESLTGPARDAVTADLRAASGAHAPFRVLAALALLDDCLRVAHLACAADGAVESAEVARTLPLAAVAAPRYFMVIPRYQAFGEAESSEAELVEFLRMHREEGAAERAWPGLRLCRRVAELAENDDLVAAHERMLVRVMEAVFAGRDSEVERAARQQLRGLIEAARAPGIDPRVAAFCRTDGPEVFSSVAYGAQVFERDPFDVEAIHADARATFQTQLERAITPVRHDGAHGRVLLVLGGAGTGKTHLLRAMRAQVHGQRLGYVGYLQMSSDVGDYSRYVLAKLLDSLERPYDAPELAESALLYLSDGLVEHGGALPREAIAELRAGEIEPGALPALIGRLVDRLMRTPELQAADSDLVHALLLLQRRDPALERRVVKFLRCDSLTSYEQELLGGLAPRTRPEDPARTIEQLGRLMFDLHQAALILLVDQIEDAIPDAAGHERVQRAIDVLRRIADALPSAVAVIACLDDVYARIRDRLTRSVVDRLEHDPAPIRLTAQRNREEIEWMLVRRLQHLYEASDAAWREDDPIFPFQPAELDARANQRARDCLLFFHATQARCMAAGGLVEPAEEPERVAPAPEPSLDDLDRIWNDALVQAAEPPDEDGALLALVERGVRASAEEVGAAARAALSAAGSRPRLVVELPERAGAARVVEVCNRSAQGGHLAAQIEALRRGASPDQVPVALRTSDFVFGRKTLTARAVGQLVAAGGLALSVDQSELRAALAFEAFAAAHSDRAGFADWRRRARPLAQLPLFRKLLDLDREEPAPRAAPPPPVRRPTPPPVVTVPPPAPPPLRTLGTASARIRLGVTPTMRAEPIAIDVEQLTMHAAFLGTTGSGKTTLALHVIEQLLERGVSALLVDRKGDLARYASPAWWDAVPSDPEAARRKRDLRTRVLVDLYTPGDAAGRPLRLPVIPSGMAEMTSQERDQVAKIAAGGLAAMIGYGKSESHRKREAILKKAIELHADDAGATLDDLRRTIAQPDTELLAAVGNLTRHFSGIAEDLDTLRIQRGDLLAGAGEPLDLAAMLSPRDGRARLAIVSAVAMTDVSVLQFWVSRLLVELGRMVRRSPSASLRAVVFLDEADTYMPAMSSPASKEPLIDLLRRARSGGLGVLLASQNPGDFDYKARDNIATWLVGRVTQDRAIEKMKNLVASYPGVGARMASQGTGSFFLLCPSASQVARELKAEHSLMKTEQLAEHDIAALAAAGRR
jgi:GTPase SAR1 family protein